MEYGGAFPSASGGTFPGSILIPEEVTTVRFGGAGMPGDTPEMK